MLLSFIINLLVGLAKSWLGEQDIKKAGAEAQQIKQMDTDNAEIAKANEAVAAVVPVTASSVLQHTSSNDPDFRD